MNVYSLRLIPSIKLKFCEFFGIASTLAVEELQGRVDRIEVLMLRLDSRLRRSTRRVPVIFQQDPVPIVKTKRKAAPKKVVAQQKPTPALPETPSVVSVKEMVVVSETQTFPVVLIQADNETREAVKEYFQEKSPLVEVSEVQQIAEKLQGLSPRAIFFDRMLLGQEASRAVLEELAQDHPGVRMVGLSSYLTLAFSQSLPGPSSDFATFLTKPISQQGLQELFSEPGRRAIS